MYWPNLNKDIQKMVNECIQCQETQNVNKKEPMIPTDAPFPWHMLYIDNFKIDGMTFLLIVDKFSKFLIVRECSLNTSSTIDTLLNVFIQQGLPVKMISDRGSNFTLVEFTSFCSSLDINLTHTSAHHHTGHGQAERMVQTTKHLIKKSRSVDLNYKIATMKYNASPVNSKMDAPCKVLNHRQIKAYYHM